DKVEDIAQQVRDDMVDTLDDLGLGYVDLLLMHWPGGFGEQGSGDADFPHQSRATLWRSFCELADKGAARFEGFQCSARPGSRAASAALGVRRARPPQKPISTAPRPLWRRVWRMALGFVAIASK
ncbi:hypothetical protein U5801_28355, partial [Lamprobacter modestohalophilus]|nr:hypothetical protein [Lamprobacter modestohalophilus]